MGWSYRDADEEQGNRGGDHLTTHWRSTLARGREAERGREARPLTPPRPRPRPLQTQNAGDQRGGRLRGFPPDQQQRDSGPGRQHQPPPPLESVNGHGPHLGEEKGVLAPLCVEGGVFLTFPPPTPAPLISNPAALCVLGVGGGMSPGPPAVPLVTAPDLAERGGRTAFGLWRRWWGGANEGGRR